MCELCEKLHFRNIRKIQILCRRIEARLPIFGIFFNQVHALIFKCWQKKIMGTLETKTCVDNFEVLKVKCAEMMMIVETLLILPF